VALIDKPRQTALEILRHVENGGFADSLLDKARAVFDQRDSAFILELVYGTLRNRKRLDWVLDRFSARPVEETDAWTRNIFRLAAYQLLFLDRVPVHAAIDTAVELAKTHGQKNNYVNGLLRNLDRGRNRISFSEFASPVERLSVLYSHPEWLIRRWMQRFGEEITEKTLANNNLHAPLVIRTNLLKTTREELKTSLASEGVQSKETLYSPLGLELIASPPLHTLSAYKRGWFMVQDEAAQLIGFLPAPHPGQMVLDACAAPGGKATHLAERMQNQGSIIAIDTDSERMKRITENTKRLGITIINPVKADASRYAHGRYDSILIDAPCSGLGLLRRHPDGRWNKRESITRECEKIQERILENCSSLLKPGGVLVYATCTTEPEENEDRIQAFLRAHPEFSLEDSRGLLPASAQHLVDAQGYYRTFPHEPSLDGFFGARLIKRNTL